MYGRSYLLDIRIFHRTKSSHFPPKIHFNLSLFLGDNGLNDRRSFLWSDISFP